jgi:hypothetical protein
MFQTISIVAITLRHQHAVQTLPTFERSLPLLAVRNNASPPGWAQNWAHGFFDGANPSSNSTSQGRSSLPWAQGVAGLPAGASAKAGLSNPVAPTNKINDLGPVLSPGLSFCATFVQRIRAGLVGGF